MWDLHVFSHRCVADCVGCGRDGRLTAITASTAVQTGHVDPVQVIVVLPSSVAQRLILTVFILTPANTTKRCDTTTTRGTPGSIWAMTKEDVLATWSRFMFILGHIMFQFHHRLRQRLHLCCSKQRTWLSIEQRFYSGVTGSDPVGQLKIKSPNSAAAYINIYFAVN